MSLHLKNPCFVFVFSVRILVYLQQQKCGQWLTLSVSTSEMMSLTVASSPMPYSFMAVSSSSMVIYL
ncbi:hypothetical protein HanRHA438_Chr05g0203251 [Helianthus annuus]|nr:hypothetical protein HanRHA438_Chr05g0203251 [Helianthus annuus]